jgi:HTH-type transcriptional regulator/antitoxin HipB
MIAVRTPQDLGRAVMRMRKSQGLTQEQAAALCGVSMPFMNSLEGGKRANISLSKVLQVLDALGMRLDVSGVPPSE